MELEDYLSSSWLAWQITQTSVQPGKLSDSLRQCKFYFPNSWQLLVKKGGFKRWSLGMMNEYIVQTLSGWEYFSYWARPCCEPCFRNVCQCQGEWCTRRALLSVSLPHFGGTEDINQGLRLFQRCLRCFIFIPMFRFICSAAGVIRKPLSVTRARDDP